MKKYLIATILVVVVVAVIYVTTSAEDPIDPYKPSFVHPGIMHTTESIEAMRSVVERADTSDPAYNAYIAMTNDFRAHSNYQMKGPLKRLDRSSTSSSTASIFRPDFESAYMNAILWCVTQDEAHAQKSIEIITAYADSVEEVPMDGPGPLLAGIQGFQLAATLELLSSTYDGLSEGDEAKVNELLRSKFLPILELFYDTPAYTNGNWGHCVNRAYLALAVLWDNEQMYRRAIDFYFNGEDNGTLLNYIDPVTGQCQESGRDQAHVQFGLACVASICEIAYNQGNDLYSASDNALLKGYEYTAKYLCGYDDLPFKTWQDATVAKKYCKWDVISDVQREKYRPMWSIAYNHYVGRLGMEMPYTLEYLNQQDWDGRYDTDGIWYDVFQFCSGAHR